MSVKILNKSEMAKQNIGHTERHDLFLGDMKQNVESREGVEAPGTSSRIITVESADYQGSEGFAKLWNGIEEDLGKLKKNEATFDAAQYYALVDKLRIDVTRRRFDYMDLTGMMNQEISNPRFSKSVTLDEFLPFGAAFVENNLAGDGVELASQAYGSTGSVTMQGYAAGFADTLENRLYNMDIFSLQRVNDAIARGNVAKRNDLSVGIMPAKTVANSFDASNKQAADAGGATAEDKLYITLDNAIEKLLSQKDPQTGQVIRAPEMFLMLHPSDMRRVERVINGQLTKASGAIVNREPLREITTIFPYYGDSIKVGKKTYTYAGNTAKKAYLFVPRIGYTLVKRPLTQQISSGSAMNLSTEQYAWYWVQTSYTDEFFGSSNAAVKAACNTAYGSGDNFGFVVECTLP